MRIKPDKQTPSSEFEFFINTPLIRYEGQYVAILGKKIVGAGASAKEVWEKVRRKYPKSSPTLAKVPRQEVLVLLSWR